MCSGCTVYVPCSIADCKVATRAESTAGESRKDCSRPASCEAVSVIWTSPLEGAVVEPAAPALASRDGATVPDVRPLVTLVVKSLILLGTAISWGLW
jgi:hypothetical protein